MSENCLLGCLTIQREWAEVLPKRKGSGHLIYITPQTLEELFSAHADMVFRIALNIVKNREEAQDVVMDTFTALLKGGCFESSEHIRAWLIRTAENKSLNVVKSSRIRRNIPLDEMLEGTLRAPLTGGELEVLDMVMRLPEKLRTTVYMFYFEDMPAAEISKALGISENTVYKRLERARSVLKTNMEGDAI